MATITKKELIYRIAASSEERRSQVKRIVQQFLDAIVEELSKGNRLEFRDFGIFETKLRRGRKAHNPKTLAMVNVPDKRTVRFKAGRVVRQKMEIHNDGDGEGDTADVAEQSESQDE